ncbi:MAG TPA: rhomboid family intramembrane serine protease [Xanthomonadaceae bacterium]|nr:rhomboid family intramembrane serine protease [Xanthomonadaceae bacterium]
MDLPLHEAPNDPQAQARHDAARFRGALLATLCVVALLWAIKTVELVTGLSFSPWAIAPREPAGLVGLLSAPLLHGSVPHLIANTLPLLVLGTLGLVLYPRAMWRALPLIWIGSGLFVWLFGRPSFHLGASGLAHGLMFFVFVTGVLRRDRAAIAGAMITFFLYGGMVLTVLPQEPGISWEAHLGGALSGLLAAGLWRGLDPAAPRKRYSWELEAEAESLAQRERDALEPPSPQDVPVLWQRPDPEPQHGQVLPFRPRRHGETDRS